MSFNIHASGYGGFTYTRTNNADEDIFDAAAVASALRAAGPGARGAAEGAADYVIPGEGSVARDAARSIARYTFLPMLRDAVDLLATHPNSYNGEIMVAPRLSRLTWADTSRMVRYNFTPGTFPGSEFVSRISPALTATNMNTYGVLRSLAIALDRFYVRLRNRGTPLINIYLDK